MQKPLFTKLIVQAAIGFFFLLVGCVYGIHSKDYMFIMLSLLIGLCSLIRTCSFYHLLQSGTYRILTGTCRKQVSTPFKKTSQVIFTDEDQQEYKISVDKNTRFLSEHRYRLYFRQVDTPNSSYTEYSSADLLGYEELPWVTENIQSTVDN